MKSLLTKHLEKSSQGDSSLIQVLGATLMSENMMTLVIHIMLVS